MRLAQYREELRKLLHAKHNRLPAMLSGVTGLLCAKGCSYWGLFPKPSTSNEIFENPERFRLFTVASWFVPGPEKGFFGYHNLPLTDTNVGEAVLRQVVISGFDPIRAPEQTPHLLHPLRKNRILESMNVCYVGASPVYEGDLLIGALSIYRDSAPPPDWFEKDGSQTSAEAEAETLQDVALFIPTLYDSAIAAQRMRAIGGVADVLKDAEIAETRGAIKEVDARKHLQSLATKLTEVFRCSEVSIFLQHLNANLGACSEFHPIASTWHKRDELFSYKADANGGLTGWVLANKRPIWIADLRTFEQDKKGYHILFPGLEHKNSLSLDYSSGSMPISFIAAPVILGGTVVGCIRCTSMPNEPRHYTETDAEALLYACSLLGTAWHRWQASWEMDQSNALWKAFLRQLDIALAECLTVLENKKPTRDQVLEKILSVVPKFVPNAGTPSVHLLDQNSRHLLQAYPPAKEAMQLDSRFSVDFPVRPRKMPGSLATAVFSSQRSMYLKNVRRNRLYAGTIEGQETYDLIICPIHLSGTKDEAMGVLSIRSKAAILDGEFTKHLAATLALQVAIFLRFLDTILEARKKTKDANQAAEKLKQQEGVLKRVFEDVRHQLKAPLDKAMMQVESLIRHPKIRTDDNLRKEAAVVRGLCRKAAGVARSVKLLADIEAGRDLVIKSSPLDYEMMILFLIQMAEDHESESDPDEPIYFSVNREGLDKIPWHKFSADMELLEQVFFCLCDNALKYSYSRTRVTIGAKIIHGGKLRFTVANVGTKVTLEESKRILNRGERGWAAQRYRGEGSGIGLFLVNQIAQAHRGSFKVIPSDAEGVTVAELIIP